MANNVNVNTVGSTAIATDEIGGVHYPIYKVAVGDEDTATPVSTSNPLPVTAPSALQVTASTALPVDVTSAQHGSNDLATDVWGTPKFTQPVSLLHGLFTFDIPPGVWKVIENGTEATYGSYTGASSTNGALSITSNSNNTVVQSLRHPRYQPNRGHLYSTALWCPSKTADGVREWGLATDNNGVFFRLKSDGLLYAVVKSGGSETTEALIDTSSVASFDVEKGNLYDIRFQWRGVGNYYFYINQVLVHTVDNLGTVTALTVENPALPARFKCVNTTADVTMNVGCVDVTSEGGLRDTRVYDSIDTGTDITTFTVNNDNADGEAVLAIKVEDTIGSEVNTRDLVLERITTFCTDEAATSIYVTRDDTVIGGIADNADPSLGWADANLLGSVKYMTGGHDSLLETTFETNHTSANTTRLLSKRVEIDHANVIETVRKDEVEYYITPGSYLVVTLRPDADAKSCGATIEWSEEI